MKKCGFIILTPPVKGMRYIRKLSLPSSGHSFLRKLTLCDKLFKLSRVGVVKPGCVRLDKEPAIVQDLRETIFFSR